LIVTDVLLVLIVLAMNGVIAVAIIFVSLAWTAADARFGHTLGKSFGIISIIVMAGYTFIVLNWLSQVSCSLDPGFEQCAR
jgi:hypothetical protein